MLASAVMTNCCQTHIPRRNATAGQVTCSNQVMANVSLGIRMITVIMMTWMMRRTKVMRVVEALMKW